MRNATTMSAVRAVAKTVTAISLAGAFIVAVSGQALATPAIAQKTGKACNACHTTPPALNAAGKKYKEGMKK